MGKKEKIGTRGKMKSRKNIEGRSAKVKANETQPKDGKARHDHRKD